MTASPVDADSADVVITAPATGRPWASFNLTACVTNGAAVTEDCLTPTCQASGTAGSPTTTCRVAGLQALTSYAVAAVAGKAGKGGVPVASPASLLANFTTPDHA